MGQDVAQDVLCETQAGRGGRGVLSTVEVGPRLCRVVMGPRWLSLQRARQGRVRSVWGSLGRSRRDQHGGTGSYTYTWNPTPIAGGGERYYLGILIDPPTSGSFVAGNVGGIPSDTVVGYILDGENVIAHELGHSVGRYHTACTAKPDDKQGADTNYPYAGHVYRERISYIIPYLLLGARG